MATASLHSAAADKGCPQYSYPVWSLKIENLFLP